MVEYTLSIDKVPSTLRTLGAKVVDQVTNRVFVCLASIKPWLQSPTLHKNKCGGTHLYF